MSLNSLRAAIYNRICDTRNLEYAIRSSSFEEAYLKSSKEDQQALEVVIEGVFDSALGVRSETLALLHSWIREKTAKDISIRDLKETARNLNISGYSRMSKSQLLSELAKRKANVPDTSTAGNFGYFE